MMSDNLKMAVSNVWERKTRSGLTLLGITIGIMAIISLMGIGEGMQAAITEELSSLSDTMFVTTGQIDASAMGGDFDPSDIYFTERDLSVIQRTPGVSKVSPVAFSGAMITYGGETQGLSILGITPTDMKDIFGINAIGLSSGEFPNEGDKNKCIVGANIADDTFENNVHVGDKIRINGEKFYVSGIYNLQGIGLSTLTDDVIHLSMNDFEKITGSNDISTVIVRAADLDNIESIAQSIEYQLDKNHGDDDFASVTTTASIIDSIQSVFSIVNIVLLSIASIALVVASIGIMNTMLTSVMERTREIGIMKAIGARNTDVLSIFLTEGLLISFIGGCFGVFMGYVGATLLTYFLGNMSGGGFSAVVTPMSVLLGMLVSLLVGLLSSLYPARKAAKMSPIEAVRYE